MSTDLTLSKAQISKIIWAGPLMKVPIPLAKNVLALLGITAAPSAIDAGIQKKNTWFLNDNFNNFKWRNEWYNENCSSSWRF